MKTETNIVKRWEEGTPHHPRSLALFRMLKAIDFKLCNDYFGWKSGGDGDNGETFLYQLDIIFEAEEAGESSDLESFLGMVVR